MPMAGDGGVRCSGSRSCGAGLEGCAGCARVEAECWKARGCTVAIGARRELSSRVVVRSKVVECSSGQLLRRWRAQKDREGGVSAGVAGCA